MENIDNYFEGLIKSLTFIKLLNTIYYGLLVDKLHPLVLNVGLAVHNADWNWKNVNSPFTRLYYITEGTAQIQLSGGIQILKPNYLYFIPAFTIHSYICNSYFCHYYLHIYEEHQSDTNLLDEWEFPVEIPAGDLDLALFQRLCAINPHMSCLNRTPRLMIITQR